MKSLFLVALAACFVQASCALKIASFNIERFSSTKVDDPTVLSLLIRILRRYDLIAVQEVMNKDDTAIIRLVQELNSATGRNYNLLISDHLGRSSYKEKYVYVYREDILKPTEWYHFDDGCENCGTDVFIREPFVARFSSLTTEVKDFALVSIHTSPDYAVREVDGLFDVWEDAKQRLLLENIVILGDYNAGCSYVKSSHWPIIRLRHDSSLQWLIGDDADTTVSTNTHCPYDRIVVGGSRLQNSVVPGSAKPFNYQVEYGLTYEQTKAASDHYPVEVEIRNDASYAGQTYGISSNLGLSGGLSLNGVCDCAGVDFTSCMGRCGASGKAYPCSCNASCTSYNDCCVDYRAACVV
ncbi:deoxyribonuclease-1-like isoform X2 [Pyxicephalus adspersus]|uniref:deoxyribonuclease-1-like isoform X2 n=1 Tax=Pyxicephalus adspersus TaxID=30357 RepID=UPI003B58E8AD